MKLQDDYDSPWKDILGIYFEEFMNFFFPEIAGKTDWEKGYTAADKELRQITREAETGKRLADRLFRVYKKNGEETWVMIHTEIQAQKETEFPHRVFVYNYRIHDLYNRPAVSLAVLADDDETWHPSVYFHELWGCSVEFRFPAVKILDYGKNPEQLEKSDNPFAVVVKAHLKTAGTKNNSENRQYWKTELTKDLYRQGFGKQNILNLYRFIDWIMVLPEELEEKYHREIIKFEEEQKMQYITTAERIGMKKGEQIGMKKGEQIGMKKGEQIGMKKGEQIGMKKGEQKKATETALNLLSMGVLTVVQIAQSTGLSEEEVENLQKSRGQYHA